MNKLEITALVLAGIAFAFIIIAPMVWEVNSLNEPYRYNKDKALCENIGGTWGYWQSKIDGGIYTRCTLPK